MIKDILDINDHIYVSYKFIQSKGVSKRTIWKWSDHEVIIIKDGKNSYARFDSIPAPTRTKLPSLGELKGLLAGEDHNKEIEAVYKKLQYAQINHFNQYRNHYRDNFGLDTDKAFKFAMKRAVWERLLQLHKERCTGEKGTLQKGFLMVLWEAYNKLYPKSYAKTALSRAIQNAKENGIDAAVVDRKQLGIAKPNLQYDERHEFFLRGILSTGKAYKATHILNKMRGMCDEAGINCPSYTWIKEKSRKFKKQVEIHNSRYGADATNKIVPYIGLQPAMFADDQYQIDGWDLPFYYLGNDRNGNPRLKKLVLIAVKDAFSRKIVGFSIDKSENRISLFDALNDAIANTGALPFELVTDNHSYNETKEVDFFVQEAKKIGMTWTVDSNPQRKSIVERGFKQLGENYCKDHYGYIGQGIRTRDKDGRSKQELIDQYQKSGKILSEDEIRMIGIEVVSSYNKTPLTNTGKSPNQLYDSSEKPKRFDLDLCERLKLFCKRTELKVQRGQINITVAGKKYEYQLSAELFGRYNSQTVAVRYDDLDRVYLFDAKTDKPIGNLLQKEKAHGALANQTDNDIEIFNRHTGRIKGIKTQARKENEDIARKAAELNPAVYDILNRHTTPKDVLKLAEEDEDYRRMVQRHGIDINRVTTVPKTSEIEIEAFKSAPRSQREKSPLAVKGNKISILNPDDFE